MEARTLQVMEFLSKNISYITPFNGDKFGLSSFLSRVDILMPTIDTLEPEYKQLILGFITDKIVGKPKENLLRHGPLTTWPELKQALIRNHGERTPIVDIIDELKMCRCESTVEDFYNKVTAILSKLNNAYILRGEGTAAQINENQRLILKHFTQNLPPLVKNLIGCHNPQTLDDAFDLLNKFGYLYFSNKSQSFPNKYNNSNKPRTPSFRGNNDNCGYNNHNQRSANYTRHQHNVNRQTDFTNRNQRHNENNYRSNYQNNFNRSNNNNSSGHYNRLTSEQTRQTYNSNRPSPQRNYQEPMDISVNESQSPPNHGNAQNFRLTPRNNYLI